MKPCNQCGKCCLKYGQGPGTASPEEILYWERYNPDIADYVYRIYAGRKLLFGDLWMSPTTNEEMKRCPWLRKLPNRAIYKCRIYAHRPSVCRSYPRDVEQMIADGCEMLESSDHKRQVEELQTELDHFLGRNEIPKEEWWKR
ncbi:MAG: YkgJ family cysteine cluster protein [Deltaproteobacteria bacterium]|nr:YkgJ family cysteine cluster protein [Deltaproteobacteria bacterium]